jgi:hypothetical protein
MDAAAAYKLLASNLSYDAGKFYSSGEQLSLGVGKVYAGVRYPLYNPESALFATLEGVVYVLTHECDIDQSNARILNEDLLVCPIIHLNAFVEEYTQVLSERDLEQFLHNLARHRVSRVFYMPHIGQHLPYGGLLYLNQITNTHVSAFERSEAKTIAAVTAYGLEIVDYMLRNHLLRPKAEPLLLQFPQ